MRVIATGGYVGFLPIAPGTWGSLVGVLLFIPLSQLPLPLYSGLLVGLIGLGIWTAGEAERLFERKDAAPIIIDEIAGMLLTYYTLPRTWGILVSGFLAFRLFDIVKTWPQLELLPRGWGVMLDDLWAAGLAHCCVRLVLLLL